MVYSHVLDSDLDLTRNLAVFKELAHPQLLLLSGDTTGTSGVMEEEEREVIIPPLKWSDNWH